MKDINTVTGYVRGGCTAVGMKKQYVTRIDASAQNLSTMVVSGGHLGTQLELKPEDLRKAANAEFADIVVEMCIRDSNSSRYMCCCIPCRGSLLFIMDRNLA